MRVLFWSILSLILASPAYADAIGVFTVTAGEVRVLRADNYLRAEPGVDAQGNDIVETAKNASAQLDMNDGSILKLGPETRLALSNYRLDADKNVVSAAVDVLSGWLRFAVAKLKPQGSYRIHTPVLTVGIRGTEGTIEAENEAGGLHLEHGLVDVTPFGNDIADARPVRVGSGEFIQRLRGRPLAKFSQPPPEFHRRLPPNMGQPLQRRVQELKRRGVPPKLIRALTREDARNFLERHPHLNQKLRQRFKPLDDKDGPDSGGRRLGSKGFGPGGAQTDVEGNKLGESVSSGIGGRAPRERQFKLGEPRDPAEVAEALRRRYQQQSNQRPGDAPSGGNSSQPKPPASAPDAGPLRDPAIQKSIFPQAPAGANLTTVSKPPLPKKPDDDGVTGERQDSAPSLSKPPLLPRRTVLPPDR